MTNIFEWADDELALILNQRGEKIRLADGTTLYFDDLVGARVKVIRRNEHVTCEAALPESTGIIRWNFEVENGRTSHEAGQSAPFPPVKNLAALISECRLELSGQL